MNYRAYIFACLVILAASCGNKQDKGTVSAVVESGKSSKFSIEKNEDYTILEIKDPWQGSVNNVLRYFLVKRGSGLPGNTDSSEVIFVPVKKIVCMSVTHVAMIEALGEENSIAAISGTSFIYSGKINERISQNLIKEAGYEASLNNELILSIKPDLVMTYGIGGESSGYVGKIRELGINVLFNADYLETDPLGKAEWIKVFGALYCKDEMADSIYRVEKEAYNTVKRLSSETSTRPKVLLGLPYKDTWYVSPGNSYISAMISDAGGEYLWKDAISSVSMPLGIENIYLRAQQADYWLNTGTASSLNEIEAIDSRFTGLSCFIHGNVYNNNSRVNTGGGNDYWENGAVHPSLVLRDIATILHPEIFANQELHYYRKLH